ncbi:MAG: Helix-turn-helix domain [Pseudomonadota bacterium]
MVALDSFKGRMLSPAQAGKETGNSESTVHRWIKSGKVQAVRISSKNTRIIGDTLAAFLESKIYTPPSKPGAVPEPLKNGKAKHLQAVKTSARG